MAYAITVLKSQVTKSPKGYSTCELSYKSADGKTKGMKIFSFQQEEIFATASAAVEGDVLQAEFKQNDKGFWQFSSLMATGEKQVTAPEATATKKSSNTSWETSEERAARQVMIVRQSSLANAIAFFNVIGASSMTKDGVTNVIEVAKKFEEYVLSK